MVKCGMRHATAVCVYRWTFTKFAAAAGVCREHQRCNSSPGVHHFAAHACMIHTGRMGTHLKAIAGTNCAPCYDDAFAVTAACQWCLMQCPMVQSRQERPHPCAGWLRLKVKEWRALTRTELVCRLAQAEEYGQPQEAAIWDFLSLMYVHQAASEGSISEVTSFGPSTSASCPRWCLRRCSEDAAERSEGAALCRVRSIRDHTVRETSTLQLSVAAIDI